MQAGLPALLRRGPGRDDHNNFDVCYFDICYFDEQQFGSVLDLRTLRIPDRTPALLLNHHQFDAMSGWWLLILGVKQARPRKAAPGPIRPEPTHPEPRAAGKMPRGGIEPPTRGFSVPCSTD